MFRVLEGRAQHFSGLTSLSALRTVTADTAHARAPPGPTDMEQAEPMEVAQPVRQRRKGPLAYLAAVETGQRRPPRGASALEELAPTAWRSLNRDGLLDVLRKLDDCSVPSASVRGELERLARLCDSIDTESVVAPRNVFVAVGGTTALLRLLAVSPAEAGGGSAARAAARLLSGVRNDCLFLLRELCFTTDGFSEMLSKHEYVIPRCFELMVRLRSCHDMTGSLPDNGGCILIVSGLAGLVIDIRERRRPGRGATGGVGQDFFFEEGGKSRRARPWYEQGGIGALL